MIEKISKEENVDPDLIRAIMFAENATGHKGPFNKLADDFKISNTPLPMNINKETGAKILGVKTDEIRNPVKNIQASAKMIKRIHERIENPTPAKIGSIWQFSGRENTNKFGEYIGRVYKDKRWNIKQ